MPSFDARSHRGRSPAVLRGRAGLVALLVGLVLAPASSATPPRAHASVTCASFHNQLAAQRAHDTRDADHDGVYCESLPCPCSAASGRGTGAHRPTAHHRSTLRLVHGRCRRGVLPDRRCTPGAVYADASVARVCRPGYARSVRSVTAHTKVRIFHAYGIYGFRPAGAYEVDHLVPLELGGSNSSRNLFPEAASPRPGFHQKDRLEDRLHELVCSGRMGLHTAQRAFERNWLAEYRRLLG